MITALIAIKVSLGKAGIPLLLATAINAIEAERARQAEMARELGTLACMIENRRVLNKECSALQRRYDELSKLKKGS